ncbi:hypothetical protein ACH5RR_015331 [Cinchona calisaya]|uniref:Uncharacterized protein n=1 Tax=Cinchona calisaya TaxID=153742 RepID=A0ABD2ZWF8_9GENT
MASNIPQPYYHADKNSMNSLRIAIEDRDKAGHQLLHQQLDKFLSHASLKSSHDFDMARKNPFSTRIRYPKLDTYNGKTDSCDYLGSFDSLLGIHGVSYDLRWLMFPPPSQEKVENGT